MYVIISPFFKTFDDKGLIYKVPDNLKVNIKIGIILELPFRKKIEYGVVLKKIDIVDITFDESKIKSIISIKNNYIFLSNYRIKLLSWIADYYISTIHNSHNLFFPKNLSEKIKKNTINKDLNLEEKNKSIKYSYIHDIKLSKEQEESYNKIKKSVNPKVLFYGLTGSGKTEIYIKLIKDNLDNKKQSLFLIPEIILTNQLSKKIQQVFGEEVIIINSTVTDAVKTKYWLLINSGKSKIIIGTRSALFYPYNNLGIIIIDEEHDNSYISDVSPRYNTIEVAEKITYLNGNKLILGSGTPSIKSMYKAIKKDYSLVSLLKKYS